MKMKRAAIYSCLAILILILSCVPAMAWEVKGGEDQDQAWQRLDADTVVNDDMVIMGNDVEVNGTINGDLLVLGQNVTINGTVQGDIIVLSSAVNLNGRTAGNFRAAAQDIRVTGTVGRNMTGAGNQIILDKGSHIEGNATLAGNNLTLKGPVSGHFTGSGTYTLIDGRVGNDVVLVTEKLELGPAASVNGQIKYTSNNELVKAPAAVVTGDISRETPPVPEQKESSSGLWTVMKAIAGLLASFVIWLIWNAISKRSFDSLQDHLTEKPLPALGWGLLTIISVPVAALLVLFTLIGIPISVIALLIYAVIFLLVDAVVGCYIGARINEYLKKEALRRPWVEALMGIALLEIVYMIPILGFWIWLAASGLCFGAIILALTAARKPIAEGFDCEIIEGAELMEK